MTEPTLKLYAHPLSSYCQKVLTALYENATPCEYCVLDGTEPVASRFAALWPIGKFPVLTDGDRMVAEASTIIEYLDAVHPGPMRFVPAAPLAAVEVRMLDRFVDNYVMTPQQKIVADVLRDGERDPRGVREAQAMLDTSYAWLDARMRGREWAAGSDFSLADCAAAPALLYADWSYPIPRRFADLWAYRDRLLARPSYARALDEARPYRHMFPLGAPEGRD
ncbi:glutathione S-transferase family protein [Sphingomonas donggukensis]|uniref:Glutathione S-transferase family protein n=1 Tax=Sphingomonas donggukensis TaxID=2949093 RepID=A0ABY4TXZ8_9SPHN|nr:glutathione S-transferase family protein [Sphingomonas donggukensis]URW75178.1 glutathione S-transferase family protein [Sphingomonas donggukensis]